MSAGWENHSHVQAGCLSHPWGPLRSGGWKPSCSLEPDPGPGRRARLSNGRREAEQCISNQLQPISCTWAHSTMVVLSSVQFFQENEVLIDSRWRWEQGDRNTGRAGVGEKNIVSDTEYLCHNKQWRKADFEQSTHSELQIGSKNFTHKPWPICLSG